MRADTLQQGYHVPAVYIAQVHGYALYKDGHYAPVKYPTDGYTDDVAGRSFHHGCFVQQLRHKAAAQPSVTCRQAFVRGLINGKRRA
jgi:squalene monooxygenase